MAIKTPTALRWAMIIDVLFILAAAYAPAQAVQPCPVGGYPAAACPIMTDEVIRTIVSSRMAGTVSKPNTPICVQVNDGVVTIVGQVADSRCKALATFLASNVRGVVQVNNLLVIGGTTANDVKLVGMVVNAIGREVFDISLVRVNVNNGVVELVGKVSSELARTVIGATASDVVGVTDVYNNLVVDDFAGANLF